MNDIEQEALLAKDDEQKLADLIERNRAWILRCASDTTHRYITDSDDEWSIALLAFSEAVRDFEGGKGSFRGFASIVIKRRILDYLRSEGRHCAEVSVAPDAFDGALDEEELGGVESEVRRRVAEEAREAAAADTSGAAREEIAAVQDILKDYGFSFFDLADCSPRTDKTKKGCALAVRTMLAIEALLRRMRAARALPMKELEAESGVKRKLLDRHRRYIIAATEILDGDFPILAGYMDFIRKG